MVKKMCTEAGFDNKTNHSLRATGTSVMFRANIPEKIIQKITGHRSIEALRSYERISEGRTAQGCIEGDDDKH